MNITQEAAEQAAKSVRVKSTNFRLPKVVGSYELGGLRFGLTKKPNKFHRLMVKIFLGWTWKD